jgi:hypothetical protein
MRAASRYRRVASPQEIEQQLAPALARWFNHQAHHRGQVHALLTGLAGGSAGTGFVILPASGCPERCLDRGQALPFERPGRPSNMLKEQDYYQKANSTPAQNQLPDGSDN